MSNRTQFTNRTSSHVNKKYNLLQKLHFRQLNGEVRRHKRGRKMLLFNILPPRLAFPLAQLAPLSAFATGHIFLGFSKCGQFLLSYTHSCDTDEVSLQITHRYRLHWWLIVPYATLRKVAEVLLFGEQDIQDYSYDFLSITICQWPNDLTKLLVYGYSAMDEGDPNTSNRRCYLTITAVPSLGSCHACHRVALSYQEEEVAEGWNSCIRLSCMQHGYTVHTSYDMVPPHPRFFPSVQLKYKDWVVLNAGNFLHVLHVSLENTHNKSSTLISSALYEGRITMAAAGTVPVSDDGPQLLHNSSGSVVEMAEGGVSDFGTRASIVSHCFSGRVDIGESSCSDTELDESLRVDRRDLTDADRDREWELLISNVPPRTSNLNTINNSVDTDSDIEICANDSSCLSDSSVCTVKDISVRFDMLKHSDNKRTSIRNRNNLRSCPVSSVTTRSKSLQRLHPHSHLVTNSSSGQSSSPYIPYYNSDCVSCNDDSDDSTLYVMQCDDVKSAAISRQHLPFPSGRRLDMFNKCDPSGTASQFARSRSEDSHSEVDDTVTRLRSRTLLRHSSDTTHGPRVPPNAAENEYEFIDEIDGSSHEKLSVFRRRRLADKRYEFSDENSENVPGKYRSFRSLSSHPVLVVPSPTMSPREFNMRTAGSMDTATPGGEAGGLIRSVYERLLSPASGMVSPNDMMRPIMASPNDVLRPINQNISSPILSPRDDRWSYDWDKIEKNGVQQRGSRESLILFGVSPSHYTSVPACTPPPSAAPLQTDPHAVQKLNCVVDINRCYIEVDDELVSIITDIEDDELSNCTGYHNALPLEVHGAGYAQMQMISNSKAEKLLMPCVRVRQLSLDVEQFCHDMAHALCRDAGKRYSCCSDYNVEIVDVCSNTGNIVAIASVLVQAHDLPPPATAPAAAPATTPTKVRTSKRPNSGNPSTSSSDTSFFTSSSSCAQGAQSSDSGGYTPASERTQYKSSSTFVFSIETKQHYVLDSHPLVEEDPFHKACHDDLCEEVCQEDRWWQSGRRLAKRLRSLSSHPTSYYSSVKVLSNMPFLRGSSLSHIMEGQHLMAIVLGPTPANTRGWRDGTE